MPIPSLLWLGLRTRVFAADNHQPPREKGEGMRYGGRRWLHPGLLILVMLLARPALEGGGKRWQEEGRQAGSGCSIGMYLQVAAQSPLSPEALGSSDNLACDKQLVRGSTLPTCLNFWGRCHWPLLRILSAASTTGCSFLASLLRWWSNRPALPDAASGAACPASLQSHGICTCGTCNLCAVHA